MGQLQRLYESLQFHILINYEIDDLYLYSQAACHHREALPAQAPPSHEISEKDGMLGAILKFPLQVAYVISSQI